MDALVNNAGMTQTGSEDDGGGMFLTLSPQALERQLDITLKTGFHLTQAVLPEMIERGAGRIVMVSSVTGPLVGAPASAAYAAANSAEASYVTGQALVVDGGNVVQEHHGAGA